MQEDFDQIYQNCFDPVYRYVLSLSENLLLLRRSRRRHFSKPCNPWIGFRVKAI